MKQSLLSLLLVFSALSAQSQDFNVEIEHMDVLFSEQIQSLLNDKSPSAKRGHVQLAVNACKQINFSVDQKAAYKETREIFLDETKGLLMSLHNARANYANMLRSPSKSAEKKVEPMARQLIQMQTKILHARKDFFHAVVFDVARVEQRLPLLRCVREAEHLMMVQKIKEAHHKTKRRPKKKQSQKPA